VISSKCKLCTRARTTSAGTASASLPPRAVHRRQNASPAPAPARISIGAAVADDRLQLRVADTGTGIVPEDRARIFDRFTRAGHRGDRGRRGDGAGLGLPIVASIAHAHGGQVLLESTPGKGSTFTLDLPLMPAADHHHGTAPAAGDLSKVHR
jgi:two-component system, OmpR family, sensor kinase